MHIPKVGGNTIKNILEEYYGFKTKYFINSNHANFVIHENEVIKMGTGFTNISKHGMLKYYMLDKEYNKQMDMNDEKWKTYYKFTFVRNPYDKIISAWKFCKQKNMIDNDISLYDFLTKKENHSSYVHSHSYLQQTDHLLDLNNELKIDFIGRFEYLYEDLNQVLFNLGIKQIKHKIFIERNIIYNKSDIDSNYIDYFDDSTIILVNDLFSDDFNNFNFKKCNNLIELKDNSLLYYFNDEQKKENNQQLLNKINFTTNQIEKFEDIQPNFFRKYYLFILFFIIKILIFISFFKIIINFIQHFFRT
jgi:hypothetical protein